MRKASLVSLSLFGVSASLALAQNGQAPEDEYLGASNDAPPLYTEHTPAAIAAEEIYIARFDVEQIALWCTRNVPSSSKAVSAGKTEWLKLHRGVIATADQLRQTNVEIDSQQRLEELAHMSIDPGASRLAAQPREVQARWCSKTAPGWILSKRFRRFDHPYVIEAFKGLQPANLQ